MPCASCHAADILVSHLCQRCFQKAVERRVRLWWKKNGTPKNTLIAMPQGTSLEAVATRALFGTIKVPYIFAENGTPLAAWSVERELESALALMLRQEQTVRQGIPFLLTVTREEMRAYCRLKNLEFTEPKMTVEQHLVEQLCRDDMSARFGLLKSMQAFEKLAVSEAEHR